MRTECLAAADAAVKAVRDVSANQLETVSPVEEAFTSAHSTPAVSTPAPQVTLLMKVSQHVHSVGCTHRDFLILINYTFSENQVVCVSDYLCLQ